jgi:hypothetical protein
MPAAELSFNGIVDTASALRSKPGADEPLDASVGETGALAAADAESTAQSARDHLWTG